METLIMTIVGNIGGMIGGLSPLYVWSAIVVALGVLLTVCGIAEMGRRLRGRRCREAVHGTRRPALGGRHSHSVVEMGTEREEMFVPGDPFPWED